MLFNLYPARQEDLQGCFVPGCCVPSLSCAGAASELITAALVLTHQIRFGLCHDKSSQQETKMKPNHHRPSLLRLHISRCSSVRVQEKRPPTLTETSAVFKVTWKSFVMWWRITVKLKNSHKGGVCGEHYESPAGNQLMLLKTPFLVYSPQGRQGTSINRLSLKPSSSFTCIL